MSKNTNSTAPKKSTLRFVPKTKWELPRQKHKSYWRNLFDDLDTSHSKVTQPLFSLLPPSLAILSESSVSIRDESFLKSTTPDKNTITIMSEPIVKISPPSPSHTGAEECLPDKSLTDSLEYLKRHDLSNFDLDLSDDNLGLDEHPKNSVEKDKITEDEEPSGTSTMTNESNMEHPQKSKAPLGMSAIFQISSVTRISRYVNNFLASTKVKMKTSISPKNHVHPLRELRAERGQGHSTLEAPMNLNDQMHPAESPVVDLDQFLEEEPKSTETPQKHVVFEDTGDDNTEEAETSYIRISRPRAPSLGVASLVPSFGRMISSLEYSDSVGSRSSIESPPDDLNVSEGGSLLQSPIPDLRPKIFLEAPAVQYPSKSVYPANVRAQAGKGYHHWPRKTIINTIKALKSMKLQEKSHQRMTKFTIAPGIHKPSSIATSSSSTEKSSRESSTSSNDMPERTISKSHGQLSAGSRALPLFEAVPSRLEDLPPIGGMYQRRKHNKCLACMCGPKISLKPVFKLPEDQFSSDFTLSQQSLITEFDNLVAAKFKERMTKSRFRPDLTDDDISPIPEDTGLSAKSNESDVEGFEKRPMKANHLERKITQSSLREDLISAKSFVSTLSLTSDQSRTISEQEDSDQGLEPATEAGEELPSGGSKFRAPCHAPLNLRPSLEPLMALKGKKSKSIQSRSASLEKSMDEGSEDGSDDDDDEAEEPAPRIREQELKRGPSLKTKDSQILECAEGKVSDTKTDKASAQAGAQQSATNDKKSISRDGHSPSDERRILRRSGAGSISDAIYNQLNVKIKPTEYNPSLSFRPVSPIMSDNEVLEMAKTSLEADKPIKDILHLLLDQYMQRLSTKTDNESSDHDPQRITKITSRLLTLLIESKLYLNPELSSSNLQFSSKQKAHCKSQQLRRFLPFKSYNLVAPILGMPEWYPKRWSALKSASNLRASFKPKKVPAVTEDVASISVISTPEDTENDFDLIVHPPSPRASVAEVPEGQKKTNPYASFISKPRRKVVIWRPLTAMDLEGYDPDSMLKNRAAKVTDKICKDFCDWLRSLGGSYNTIDEEMLKDMFKTDFSVEACRTMRVPIQQMPMVPAVVAGTRNRRKRGEPKVIRRQLIRDAAAEPPPAKIVGFGSTAPNPLRYQRPKNVDDKGIRYSTVPRDLETMSFVWDDITHLNSFKGFSEWLKQHSHMKLPKPLQKMEKDGGS